MGVEELKQDGLGRKWTCGSRWQRDAACHACVKMRAAAAEQAAKSGMEVLFAGGSQAAPFRCNMFASVGKRTGTCKHHRTCGEAYNGLFLMAQMSGTRWRPRLSTSRKDTETGSSLERHPSNEKSVEVSVGFGKESGFSLGVPLQERGGTGVKCVDTSHGGGCMHQEGGGAQGLISGAEG